MDDINIWLQSQEKDYTQGVNLFEKHHKNRMLAKYFRNGNLATHSKKLEYESLTATGTNSIGERPTFSPFFASCSPFLRPLSPLSCQYTFSHFRRYRRHFQRFHPLPPCNFLYFRRFTFQRFPFVH
jgi:hypothetical protein